MLCFGFNQIGRRKRPRETVSNIAVKMASDYRNVTVFTITVAAGLTSILRCGGWFGRGQCTTRDPNKMLGEKHTPTRTPTRTHRHTHAL